MALKIRLWQQGCANKTSYRVVVADSRSPRDGKYVEAIGWYNPSGKTTEQLWMVREDRLQHWLSVGAQMTSTVAAVAKKATPTAYREHTQRLEARRTRRALKRHAA
jgi:small subunit ribosomal protein S16